MNEGKQTVTVILPAERITINRRTGDQLRALHTAIPKLRNHKRLTDTEREAVIAACFIRHTDLMDGTAHICQYDHVTSLCNVCGERGL